MNVIVLAGGTGSRLKSVVSDVPKPLAPVNQKPFLYYILNTLDSKLIDKIILAVGFKHELIQQAFGSHFNQIPIEYSIEHEALGTGGAIKQALERADSQEVLILNGDTFFNVDIETMLSYHKENNFDFTFGLKQMNHPYRYGTVEIENNRIVSFKEKDPTLDHGLINGGVYLCNADIYSQLPVSNKFSFEQEFLEPKVASMSFGAFISTAYFIDIGIPEDYEKAQTDFSN